MDEIWYAISEFFVGNISTTLAIVMLVVIAMLGGAYALWRQTGDATKPVLMVILAIVAVVNVLIWTVPTDDGTVPLEAYGEAEGD